MMHVNTSDSNDNLNDAQLLEREWLQRDEFERLQKLEPESRGTTYGPGRGSSALVHAWERWWQTNFAARMRGILERVIGR
jgi:hypothetical protein